MTTDSDLTAITLALASAKTSCTNCSGVGHYKEAEDDFYDCSICESTGEVYVLGNEVRVEQGCIYGAGNHPHEPREHCDGRGWNPLDYRFGWDWMAALAKTGPWYAIFERFHDHWRVKIDTELGGDVPETVPALILPEAFFQAAMKALELDITVGTNAAQ